MGNKARQRAGQPGTGSEEDTRRQQSGQQLPTGRGHWELQKSQAPSASGLCASKALTGEACSYSHRGKGLSALKPGQAFLFFTVTAAAPLALYVSNLVNLVDAGTNMYWEIPKVEILSKNLQENKIKCS